jgi:kumamolisin
MAEAPGALLTREQLGARHGAHADDVERVRRFAAEHHLDVVAAHPERRSVVLGGSVGALSAAFGVELQRWERPGAGYRGRIGALHLPEDLADAVEGVFGLDDRPQAQPHFRPRATHPTGKHAARGGFTPPQVAALYEFPRHLDGRGETVAILEVGGGYRREDLDAYFASLHLRRPEVVDVFVDHGKNSPTGDGPDSDDGEVLLDIEVVGAVAPGARLAVYWAPNTERGFIDAFSAIVHDTRHRPSVLTVSWGSAETTWTRQAVQAIDGILQDAAAVGVTVLAASGDNGSHDGVHDGRAHVDFPASSRTCWPAAAPACTCTATAPWPPRRPGTTVPTAAPPAAASARSSRCRPGSAPPTCRPAPTPATARAAASPTWRATPTPRPATACASTVRTSCSAAPARWPRSGPG